MLDAPSAPPKTRMLTAQVVAPGRIELRERARREPQPNELVVRLEGCGVCASNLPPWEGRSWFQYPLEPGALGHEGWGCVESLGANVRDFAIGDRVGLLSQHAYATYDVAAEDAVVKLTDKLAGLPFPAEPLGCALNIFRRSEIRAGQTVAIVGIGFLGALLTQLASRAGARVLAISRRNFALEIALQMGAAEIISLGDNPTIMEQVRCLTNNRMCDVVIEAVGKQTPLDLAGELTAERGRLVVAGYHQDGLRQINLQLWNWRGIDVINAHERDPKMYLRGMSEAVEAVASGRLNPAPLYTHRYPLAQLGAALDATRQRPDGFMKALIEL
jgi:threonine dehydrogenase-like Zn-dependent dehydrogenase